MLNQHTVTAEAEERRLMTHFSAPLNEQEKCSGKHATKEAGVAFFAPRKLSPTTINSKTANNTMPQATTMTATTTNFCKAVATQVEDATFKEKHNAKSAPLAMIAFAGEAVEKSDQSKGQFCF